jgi:hypothetical protein
MIVKTKRGYYVYSAPTIFGKRKRLSNALPTRAIAQRINKCKKCGRKRKK